MIQKAMLMQNVYQLKRDSMCGKLSNILKFRSKFKKWLLVIITTDSVRKSKEPINQIQITGATKVYENV